jgi:hypothetical protein
MAGGPSGPLASFFVPKNCGQFCSYPGAALEQTIGICSG